MNKLLLFTAGLVLAAGAFAQNKGTSRAASTSKPRGSANQGQKEAAQSNFQKPKYHSIVKGKYAKKAKGG